jgi:hypothetical protein
MSLSCPLPLGGGGSGTGGGRVSASLGAGPLGERVSLQDLCERHEKGALHKHQRAPHKYGLMKRQAASPTHSREPESVEQLESRIVEVGIRGPCERQCGGTALVFCSWSFHGPERLGGGQSQGWALVSPAMPKAGARRPAPSEASPRSRRT